MSPIASAALKVALSGAAIGIVLFRTKHLSRQQLGLVRPPIAMSLLLVTVYVAWMLGSDAAIQWRGRWDWRPWIEAPLAASAMRVTAVCLLGPAAEELIFRGWLFNVLEERWGMAIAITLSGVGWALLHYTYTWAVISVIAVDGLLLGIARWRTGSVYVPIVMHVLYNFYAIW